MFEVHSPKQEQALFGFEDHGYSITLATTGIQWGKTITLVHWLKMQMHKHTAKDDNFILCSPSYPILSQSTLPPFLSIMDGLGRYDKKYQCFEMNGGGTCWFRTGTKPDSIVGITNVRAIAGDECGLFSLYFWENIQGRAAFKGAPIYLGTSPYSLNWIFKEIVRPKLRDPSARPDVLWVHARSDENPYFPKARYEDRKATMDPRRFNMMFGGRFDRMEGLVYRDFSDRDNIVDYSPLPLYTKYVAGVDWGHTHPFVIKVRAITPDGTHYDVAEFYKTGLSAKDMVEAGRQMTRSWGIKIFYADPARPDLIQDFNSAGLPCVGANNDILDGIEHHRDLIRTKRYKIIRGMCPHTEDELETYHYPDPKDLKPDQDDLEPLPVDKDNHCMDADRYISRSTHTLIRREVIRKETDPRRMSHDERLEWLRKPKGNKQTEEWN